jgi:uncharacterized protein (TIGR03118 family)
LLTLTSVLTACGDKNLTNVVVARPVVAGFNLTRLVANNSAGNAPIIDPDLVNPWGIAFNSAGILWVSDNGTGVSTLYNADGSKVPTTVPIVGANGGKGAPTGLVFNTTTDFAVPGFGAGAFIFAGLDGALSVSNPSTGTATLAVDRSSEQAEYTGLAMAVNGGANFLYAANFRHAEVDVFDAGFNFVGSFTDPNMSAGFAPFGIANIGGQLYVTFAKQSSDSIKDVAGVGNGFVDVFNADGSVARRFVSNGNLNSPWAVVMAPAGFGPFSGDILIGNFGDGKIGAYNPSTGAFVDFVRDASGNVMTIGGLWGLAFGPSASSTTLYFAAGINNETGGLLGTLTPR